MNRLNLYRILVLVGFLGSWQFLSGRFIESNIFSSPSGIYFALVDMALGKTGAGGTLVQNLIVTLIETVEGFAFGVAAGIPLGLFLGLNKTLGKVLDPFILLLYSVPKITLAPILIIWFGIGIASKVALAFTLVFFLVFFNTFEGVANVSPDLVRTIRVMGASRLQLVTKVTIPSTFPYVFVGLRTALPYALIGAVVGEFIVSNAGLGFFISYESAYFNADAVFAGILVVSLIALVLDQGLKVVSNRMLRWRPS